MSITGKSLELLEQLISKWVPFSERAIARTAIQQLEGRITHPIAMRLNCPGRLPDGSLCGALHIDEGEFATKPHHTHSCQICGMTWRPAIVHTVGVQFLPGFKNFLGATGPDGPLAARHDYRSGDGVTSYGLGSQANEPPEPIPVVIGSIWQYRDEWLGVVDKILPATLGQRKTLISCGSTAGGPRYEWPADAFLRAFTWVRDPS